MYGLIEKYNKLSLRVRLTISYIVLIVVSMTVLGIGYYIKSSQVILQNASGTYLGLVKTSNKSLDAKFATVEQSAINMHLDEELFELFNTTDLQARQLDYETDRKITRILQKYFPSSEDFFSVNLATKDYMFGGNPNFWIPKKDFSSSDIYQTGLKAIDKTIWIPTYNLLEKYFASTPAASRKDQNVFTAARFINLSRVTNNLLKGMDKGAERPILLVNFQESMISRAFKESLVVKDSYYYVFTKDMKVISTSDHSGDKLLNQEWTRSLLDSESGTRYVRINGEKMVVCFDQIATTGWISAVFIPYDNLLKTVPNMFSYTFYSTVLILILSIFLASFFSNRITMPLKKLLWGIKQIGEGNFNARIETHGTSEVNLIIHKFNHMNDKIQTLIKENYETSLKEIEAELKALNFQFNPHFLYNTLNIINYLAIENKQAVISNMLVDLSEMLEYTAKKSGEVTLGEDVSYLKSYDYIMKQRFEDKFQIQYDIDPALYRYTVPKFFLQPFIENAIIHGLEDCEEGGCIRVSGQIAGKLRVFTIEDNGKGMEESVLSRILAISDTDTTGNSKSIGIENVNKRVKLIYGEPYGVTIESQVLTGTKVTIILPMP
ncbi:sensor histidine kinase [Paenibacillus chondroitinus]|uniref:Sensor histidine kinase n=1 Tax=Paenibacillus chondroitinus TaxID=59842 RepID=A0ABU6DEN8_9BACL|nr:MULTISPECIES: sensor histidine kinase [Paenibacillus]MCY9660016.1 sensor histidine kinase [Paenibacillus anseongense]MEB4795366.1 sensor histidine kinase [Paenibacillus chondroitinus]